MGPVLTLNSGPQAKSSRTKVSVVFRICVSSAGGIFTDVAVDADCAHVTFGAVNTIRAISSMDQRFIFSAPRIVAQRQCAEVLVQKR